MKKSLIFTVGIIAALLLLGLSAAAFDDVADGKWYSEGIDFCAADPDRLCLNSAKAQLFVADALLSNDAAAAKEICANYKPLFPSISEYFKAVEELTLDKDAVIYDEGGSATLDYL